MFSLSHVYAAFVIYWTAPYHVNPYMTIAGGICLACILISASRIFDRSVAVSNISIFDILNLLCFSASAFIYPASYCAHHTEIKTAKVYLTNDSEFVFWFFMIGSIVSLYNRKVSFNMILQSIILSLILAYTSDIVVEEELTFDLWEFFSIWVTLFVAFGLLPALTLQSFILNILKRVKSFVNMQLANVIYYQFTCYIGLILFLISWNETLLHNSSESLTLGLILYVGIHLILPQIFVSKKISLHQQEK